MKAYRTQTFKIWIREHDRKRNKRKKKKKKKTRNERRKTGLHHAEAKRNVKQKETGWGWLHQPDVQVPQQRITWEGKLHEIHKCEIGRKIKQQNGNLQNGLPGAAERSYGTDCLSRQ
jgi:hypothetical protein